MKPATSGIFVCFSLAVLLVQGCATTPSEDKPAREPRSGGSVAQPRTKTTFTYPTVSMEVSSRLLHQVVRQIGEEAGGGLVIMDGISELQTKDYEFKNKGYAEVVRQLAETTGNKYHQFPGYFFIYPDGYGSLLEVSLEGVLDARYAQEVIGFSVGANNRLYNVLNLLGHSLGVTIVADNFIADARCGEITLHEVPLTAALEAVLRSARIPQGQLFVQSTPEYIFLGTERTAGRGNLVENAGATFLDKAVTVYLPHPVSSGEALPFYHEIMTLGQVRGRLEEQLGVPVQMDTALQKLPVNPCAMNGVTVRDALNLLLWQWPVDEVRCRASADGVRFLVARPAPPAREETAPPADSAEGEQ